MNVLKPNQRATVITLLERSTTQREIARITGIDRKTIRSYHQRWLADLSNSPGVATGSEAVATQIPPPWPPTSASTSYSLCEPHRDFIEAQLLSRRNAMAIYQDLVDAHGFTAAYNSVKRFVRALRKKTPEQFDRLSFLPGEEMQVDYGEGDESRRLIDLDVLAEDESLAEVVTLSDCEAQNAWIKEVWIKLFPRRIPVTITR